MSYDFKTEISRVVKGAICCAEITNNLLKNVNVDLKKNVKNKNMDPGVVYQLTLVYQKRFHLENYSRYFMKLKYLLEVIF